MRSGALGEQLASLDALTLESMADKSIINGNGAIEIEEVWFMCNMNETLPTGVSIMLLGSEMSATSNITFDTEQVLKSGIILTTPNKSVLEVQRGYQVY